jgi:hypothetical protein
VRVRDRDDLILILILILILVQSNPIQASGAALGLHTARGRSGVGARAGDGMAGEGEAEGEAADEGADASKGCDGVEPSHLGIVRSRARGTLAGKRWRWFRSLEGKVGPERGSTA